MLYCFGCPAKLSLVPSSVIEEVGSERAINFFAINPFENDERIAVSLLKRENAGFRHARHHLPAHAATINRQDFVSLSKAL